MTTPRFQPMSSEERSRVIEGEVIGGPLVVQQEPEFFDEPFVVEGEPGESEEEREARLTQEGERLSGEGFEEELSRRRERGQTERIQSEKELDLYCRFLEYFTRSDTS